MQRFCSAPETFQFLSARHAERCEYLWECSSLRWKNNLLCVREDSDSKEDEERRLVSLQVAIPQLQGDAERGLARKESQKPRRAEHLWGNPVLQQEVVQVRMMVEKKAPEEDEGALQRHKVLRLEKRGEALEEGAETSKDLVITRS